MACGSLVGWRCIHGVSRTCGWIMTFRGAVVGWTPIVAGARGRARCRNDSVATAMLGGYMVSRSESYMRL
jgi:hypothetical protein